MKILVLNWRDINHPLAGGAEISLYHHVKFWISKGATVTWCASMYPGAKSQESRDGISYLRKGSHFTSFIKFLYYFNKNNANYDLIIDCFHFFPYFSLFYKGKNTIVGLINEVAGKIWFQNLPYPFALIGFVLEPFIIRLYKKKIFITGSNSAKSDLVRVGLSANKIHVVHHGFTPSMRETNVKKKTNTLVFLARISKDKGIEDALEVVNRLKKDNKNVLLTIIGKPESKEYEEHIHGIIKEKGIEKNCKITGFISEDEKYKILANSTLLIHPSIKEGWGLNVIEANSVGTPAVGYKVAGLVDSIVDGKTGSLAKLSIDDLYSKTKELLENTKKYSEFSKEAIRWADTFSWESAGKLSFDIIKSQISK